MGTIIAETDDCREAARVVKRTSGRWFVSISGTELSVQVIKVDLVGLIGSFGDGYRWLIVDDGNGEFSAHAHLPLGDAS